MSELREAPVAWFRIYPGSPRGLRVRVIVWPTFESFGFWQRQVHGCAKTGVNYEGERKRVKAQTVFLDDVRDWRGRRDPVVAEISYRVGHLDLDTIVHESLHAALAWARRRGLPVDGSGADERRLEREELVCYAHAEIVGLIRQRGRSGIPSEATIVRTSSGGIRR